MPRPVLAIGLGGTGKAVLTIFKERLIETYGEVPDNVVLLAFDTDDLREVDSFAGISLQQRYSDRDHEPEFRQITSIPGATMDTVFNNLASGRTTSYMNWLEYQKLDRTISPVERDIRGGAQQRRPVGRVAVFQRWNNPIRRAIQTAIAQIYGKSKNLSLDTVNKEISKRQVFIVGSVAGGTGSGMLIDIANLARSIVSTNPNFNSVDISAVIALPDAFSFYTEQMHDSTNLKPNTYAALRELDRFMRAHNNTLPYMIRYDENMDSITWVTAQMLDHVYLVDTVSPDMIGDFNLSDVVPTRGVFPLIADFVMAHVDQSLGDQLASLRSNAGIHYNKEEGWQYSAFNIMTYIFPVDDVIESFSYRFLREVLARQFLSRFDLRRQAETENFVVEQAEKIFSQTSVHGKINPGIVQKMITATRRFEPEIPDLSWQGLFNLISLLESDFAQDYQRFIQCFTDIDATLVPSKINEYKKESYEDGNTRLLNDSDNFTDQYLGKRIDQDNEEARISGTWDQILNRYCDALRIRFAEVLDAAILNDALNLRDPATKALVPNTLPRAIGMTIALKDRLVKFKGVITREYQKIAMEARIRKSSEDLRTAIAWMDEAKDKNWALFGMPEARRAQNSYIDFYREKMELQLWQKIYKTVIEVLDTLGAADEDKNRRRSVVEEAKLDLEKWSVNFQQLDMLLARQQSAHNTHRADKASVRVRHYLTDDAFENQLYLQPENRDATAQLVCGQIKGTPGLNWVRTDSSVPLNFKLETIWAADGANVDETARNFLAGAKEIFRNVRQQVTATDRIANEIDSPPRFVGVVNKIVNPFLRYNRNSNGKTMFVERYLSFNSFKASDQARKFLDEVAITLGNTGVQIDKNAESLVAVTVVEVSRGVRLTAVDQFTACEPDYRANLYRGIESLHLFPEEQLAAQFESRIDTLGQLWNRQRPLLPDVVATMGDEAKLRQFAFAWAYGLISPSTYVDDKGIESTEIILRGKLIDESVEVRLSDNQAVSRLDSQFTSVTQNEQINRLFLNALQNFTLRFTEKPGISSSLPQLLAGLKMQNAYMDESFFSLNIKKVGDWVQQISDSLTVPARVQKINSFIRHELESLKASPRQPIIDLATIMEIILIDEIRRLEGITEKNIDDQKISTRNTDRVTGLAKLLGRFYSQQEKPMPIEGLAGQIGFDPANPPQFKNIEIINDICEFFAQQTQCTLSKPEFLNNLWVTKIDSTPFTGDILFERSEAITKISPIIPIVFGNWSDFEAAEAALLFSILDKLGPSQSIAIVILSKEYAKDSRRKSQLTERMHIGYGKDIVILDSETLLDLFSQPNPRSGLRGSILSQIDLKRISPYKISGPVVSNLVFSGREEELNTIVSGIDSNNYILIGGRRIGKTSILRRLENRIPTSKFRTFFYDCSIISSYSEFLQLISKNKSSRSLKMILETMILDEKHLVLLFDEVDKLLKLPHKQALNILNNLRAQSNAGYCNVILSGEHVIKSELDNVDSPLYHFGHELIIGCLKRDEMAELVTRPMKQLGIELAEQEAILEYVWNLTGGHPNVVQRLCQRMVETGARYFLLSDVQKIASTQEFLEQDFLSIYWERATPLEKLCTLIMALNRDARTLIDIHSAVKQAGVKAELSEIDVAVSSLKDLRNILRKDTSGYEFKISVFPQLISKTALIKDLIALNIDAFNKEQRMKL